MDRRGTRGTGTERMVNSKARSWKIGPVVWTADQNPRSWASARTTGGGGNELKLEGRGMKNVLF